MALKITVDKKATAAEQRLFLASVEADIVRAMQYAGETFVKDARSMTKAEGGFGDRTGNLRSSIGYFIYKDGQLVKSDLTGTSEGISKAKIEASKVVRRQGYQLIGVAGMNYASAVESRGLNVITIQGIQALYDLDDYFEIIERKYKRK